MLNSVSFFNGRNEGVSLTASAAGFEFDYLSNKWKLDRNISINLDFLDEFEPELAGDVRETLTYFAEHNKSGYVSNLRRALMWYLEKSKQNEFNELGFATYKAVTKKKDEPTLAVSRTFIRQMRFLGLDKRIDPVVYELTDSWSLYGGDKGVPVLSLDPEDGPFDPLEFEAIGFNSAHKFAEGKLSLTAYSLILLFKATGRRREQIACLKIKDFSYTAKFTGTKMYVVTIPRIKQRGGRFRSVLSPFGLVDSIGQVIERHILSSVAKMEKKLGRRLTSEERDEMPLFMSPQAMNLAVGLPDNDLLEFLKSEMSHYRSGSLGEKLIQAVNKLRIISVRTGYLLHANPYRFRYTIGTRAAQEGAGIVTIARLLDHSDTQHVDCYRANVPEHAISISQIMNLPLARYASAFAGKIVKDEQEANQEVPGATRIPCREKDCDVGSCGTSAFCQDYAPIACYLCTKFRPWVDAPHELVLEWLLEERERLALEDNSADNQVVVINDRAILAVAQVIQECKEKHQNV